MNGARKRINPAVSFSVTRYVLAVGLFAAVVVFGLVSLRGLGVDLLPEVNIPAVVVRILYPGATPDVVDLQVTQVVENAVSTLSGITEIDSASALGVSRVVLQFDPSIDRDVAANQVATQVAAAVRNLPTGISPPTVQTFDPNAAPILQFGISGGGSSLTAVNDYVVNDLTPALERVPGLANVEVDGAPALQFQVLLSPDRLRYYSLTPQDVVNAITSSAVNLPIGTIVAQNNALTFSTENIPADTGEIARTLVDSGRGITVAELGSVRRMPAAVNYARVNGKPQILISIQKTINANSVAVVNSARAMLASLSLPKGYILDFSNDTTGPIRASVQATYRELGLTALVVALVVLLFLGKLNTAFSVILAIPIALSAAPILYRLAGFTLNLVSLLALIVAIGIVVDDSIVVSENVERYRVQGLGRKESVLKGASEVFSAVVAATLSLLSVLLPVSFIGGFIGRYLMQFSLGLAAAVAFSLLEAVLFLTVRLAYTPESRDLGWRDLVPALLGLLPALRWGWRAFRRPAGIVVGVAIALVLAATRRFLYLPALLAYPLALGLVYYAGRLLLTFLQALTSTLHGWTEAGLEWVRDLYTRSLGRVLHAGAWILAGSAAFLVTVGVLVAPRIPFDFVPNTDAGTFTANLRMPPDTPLSVTNVASGRLEAFLLGHPEVTKVQAVIGGAVGIGSLFAGTNSAQLTVQLLPVGRRPSVFQLMPQYRAGMLALLRQWPTAQIFISAGGGFAGSALLLNITSPNYSALTDRNNAILDVISKDPWVSDVQSSLSNTTLQSVFVPDPTRLRGTGITPGAIAAALETYATGTQASTVITGGLSYPIQVQADPAGLSGGQSLLDLPVYSPTLNTTLSVGQLGRFMLSESPVTLNRYDRNYTGQFTVNFKPGAPPVLAMQDRIAAELQKARLLDSTVTLQTGGRFSPAALARQLETTGPATFLLAIFLAYLVMAAQFNSWRYPIYLLLPVPLALIGALLVVFLNGGGLDVFGLLGMLMLIGLSAKNAILYLDFVVDRIGRMPFREALIEAARLRFRPIVMTTMTVLVISFPLVFGRGQGSEYGQRMGVVMFGGIVFSAVLTFFVVPAAFYLFERKRVARLENDQAAKGQDAANTEGQEPTPVPGQGQERSPAPGQGPPQGQDA
jgi:HAE1 family hydrophobic/amphiphilic exporter-1